MEKAKFYLLLFFMTFNLPLFSNTDDNKTEEELKKIIEDYYLNTDLPDPIVGIYYIGVYVENYKNNILTKAEEDIRQELKFAIIYEDNSFYLQHIEMDDIKPTIVTKLSSSGLYIINKEEVTFDFDKFSFLSACEWESNDVLAKHFNVKVKDIVNYGVKVRHCQRSIRYYPNNVDISNFDNERKSKSEKSSGTGFAIATNGYIVTNNHVIDGADKISVKGINGDFSKSYSAKVISTDKNNDLAILKIDSIEIKDIPYSILGSSISVGEDVFTLGYPLTATMGEEVKLTNGIISSKSGFQGDITTYQTSIPVQPGNSGGPVFNSDGNLIAVITSKHLGTDNVSYAVKSIYINALIDSISEDVKLSTGSKLTGVKLSDQVKQINKFVYLIQVN